MAQNTTISKTEKVQTAVEWLWHHFNVSITKPDEDMLDHANKMFEEQIIKAHVNGYMNGGNTTAKQYYNETYGKN